MALRARPFAHTPTSPTDTVCTCLVHPWSCVRSPACPHVCTLSTYVDIVEGEQVGDTLPPGVKVGLGALRNIDLRRRLHDQRMRQGLGITNIPVSSLESHVFETWYVRKRRLRCSDGPANTPGDAGNSPDTGRRHLQLVDVGAGTPVLGLENVNVMCCVVGCVAEWYLQVEFCWV